MFFASQERYGGTRNCANDPKHAEATLKENARKSALFCLEQRRLREGKLKKIMQIMVS